MRSSVHSVLTCLKLSGVSQVSRVFLQTLLAYFVVQSKSKILCLVIKQTIFVAAMACSQILTIANVFMTAPMVMPSMNAVDKVLIL